MFVRFRRELASFLIFVTLDANAAMHDVQPHMHMQKNTVYPMTRESSGTSWQPDSTPHQGWFMQVGDWQYMVHGHANLIYDNQGGPRGDEKTLSSNMLMLMARKPLDIGSVEWRSMVSLDPLMGKEGYPLLFQTGETADGVTPLVDHQHPHDFWMELAGIYHLPVSDHSEVFAYAGLPGEPALGPPAFMHRFSGVDISEAPLTHHWLDSTHITYGVTTLGYTWNTLKIEGSLFNGSEPDQARWNMESPKLNSQSIRFSYNPLMNWALQISYGHLQSPEQLEPNVDVNRTTASATYNKPFGTHNNWQTTVAWGQNDKQPGHTLNGYLLESTVNFYQTHTFFGRLERVAEDELFDESSPFHDQVFIIKKLSLGYLYDFLRGKHFAVGVGGLGSVYDFPAELEEDYGDHPFSYMVFTRIKLV